MGRHRWFCRPATCSRWSEVKSPIVSIRAPFDFRLLVSMLQVLTHVWVGVDCIPHLSVFDQTFVTHYEHVWSLQGAVLCQDQRYRQGTTTRMNNIFTCLFPQKDSAQNGCQSGCLRVSWNIQDACNMLGTLLFVNICCDSAAVCTPLAGGSLRGRVAIWCDDLKQKWERTQSDRF